MEFEPVEDAAVDAPQPDDRRQRLEERQTFVERDIDDLRDEVRSLNERLGALNARLGTLEALLGRLTDPPPEAD